jgi:hypothetical protein
MTHSIFAEIFTKNNFYNLNGQWLPVVQMWNTRITCIHKVDGMMQEVDFMLHEIAGFKYNVL